MSDQNRIFFQLNALGPCLDEGGKRRLLAAKGGEQIHPNYQVMEIDPLVSFLGKDWEMVSADEIERYCEITDKETHTAFTPAPGRGCGAGYEKVFKRILEPIAFARKYYAIGEYLPAITMAGLAAEMLTMAAWEMTTIRVDGKPVDNDKIIWEIPKRNSTTKKNDCGRKKFIELSQYERIRCLRSLGLILDEDFKLLDDIRGDRNQYTHEWDIDHQQDKGVAKRLVRQAQILFKNISGMTGLSVSDQGRQAIKINPRFWPLLESSAKK